MLFFSHSKINIGLRVCEKRDDGFHSIQSIFIPIDYSDSIEIIESKKNEFIYKGLEIDCEQKENILYKVFSYFQKHYGVPHSTIILHKRVRFKSGLGGGSSNGAFLIKLLNKKYKLGLSTKKLFEISLRFGSDCPFFIENSPKYVEGRGEILHSAKVRSLENKKIVLLFPDIKVSTSDAYSKVQLANNSLTPLSEEIEKPIHLWKKYIGNSFEENVFKQFPEVQELKNKLYRIGALYASMTGSGSCVYGIFNSVDDEYIREKFQDVEIEFTKMLQK